MNTPDINVVIESLKRCILGGCPSIMADNYFACVYKDCVGHCRQNVLLMDAVELLEQQKHIVRCKDCKHRPTQTEPDKTVGFSLEFPDYICPCQCSDGYYSWYPNDNWFCADGERKDNE